MLQNYLNKSGKLNAKAESKLCCFNGINHVKKLSDFYNSRTTNLAGILFEDLFIISRDKTKIINAGFSPTCKAIIQPNEFNEHTVKFFAERALVRLEEVKRLEIETNEYNSQLSLCKLAILSDSRFSDFVENQRKNGKSDRNIAWKLSSNTRVPNLSQFSIKVIYNCI